MAMQSPALEKELLQTELVEAGRLAFIQQHQRALNNEENAAMIADIKKLLLGRDAWLKQMREAKLRETRQAALTQEQEDALKKRVRELLEQQPDFIANFKYKSDDVSSKSKDVTGFEGMLKEFLPNMTSMFGGEDGPFGFIGKLFESILGFVFKLFNMAPAFKEMGEKLNPKPTPADLVQKGSLDQADAELAIQEEVLIAKLRSLKNKEGEEVTEIKRLADEYEAKLLELQTIELDDGNRVPFADASEQYKKRTLELRIKAYNEVSEKAAPILKAHAEADGAEQDRKLKEERHGALALELTAVAASPAPVLETLTARINALNQDMKVLAEKRQAADNLEKARIATPVGGGHSIVSDDFKRHITNMFVQHKQVLFTQEQARQNEKLQQEADLAQQRALEQQGRRAQPNPLRPEEHVERVD